MEQKNSEMKLYSINYNDHKFPNIQAPSKIEAEMIAQDMLSPHTFQLVTIKEMEAKQ